MGLFPNTCLFNLAAKTSGDGKFSIFLSNLFQCEIILTTSELDLCYSLSFLHRVLSNDSLPLHGYFWMAVMFLRLSLLAVKQQPSSQGMFSVQKHSAALLWTPAQLAHSSFSFSSQNKMHYSKSVPSWYCIR